MLLEEAFTRIPNHWCPMDCTSEKYKIVPLEPQSAEYRQIERSVRGPYMVDINGIYRCQQPLLHSKFILKHYEYSKRGPVSIYTLYRDMPSEDVTSMMNYNFDWRCVENREYGPGVYFYGSPVIADKHSHRITSQFRSMITVNVLVQNIQFVEEPLMLPDFGYDTVAPRDKGIFVKYFDSEFYPMYVVDYLGRK